MKKSPKSARVRSQAKLLGSTDLAPVVGGTTIVEWKDGIPGKIHTFNDGIEQCFHIDT